MIDCDSALPSQLCPSAEEIRIYAQGGTDEQRAQQLEEHMLNCAQCETMLDCLDDPSDAIIQTLAALPTSPEDEQSYQQLREAALKMPMTFADATAVSDQLQRVGRLADPALGPLPFQLGHYLLTECIGRGASGAVYRAQHVKLEQTFAVKVLDDSGSFAADAFLQEMKTIGALAHPHIVRATDAGEDTGLHYLVMEYVEGIDAARLLFRNGALPVAEACEIARQAAIGLQFVHQHQLVHRDIKPSNLLVTVDGQVKLLDLGIATPCNPQSSGKDEKLRPQGTYDYMAPELWANPSAVDPRADMFSLGCTLLKLLTGKRPTDLSQTLDDTLVTLPKNVARLLRRLLEADPAARLSSVDEVIKLLNPLSRGADLRSLVAEVCPLLVSESQTVSAPAGKSPLQGISRRQAIAGLTAAGLTAAGFSFFRFGMTPHLRKAEWRLLKPITPELLLVLGDKEQTKLSCREDGQIDISSQDMTLIHMGRPVNGLFKLQVAMLQASPQSGGVFFRGQFLSETNRRVFRFQTIQLVAHADATTLGQPHLLWSQWIAQRENGQIKLEHTPLAEVSVELISASLGQQLQITCGRRGMPEVEWNGQQLDESLWKFSIEARNYQRLPAAQLPTAYLGRLGVINSQGSTTFIQPRLAYL